MTETFVKQRPTRSTRKFGRVTVDAAVSMIGRFRNGSAEWLFFDLEEMNRLKFFSNRDSKDRQGFRGILVTELSHPYIKNWWPPGHIIGYEHTFVHTMADFVKGVVLRKNIWPTFEDGLKTQRVLGAVQQSAKSGSCVTV